MAERSENPIWLEYFTTRLVLFRANNPRNLGQWTLYKVQYVQESCERLRSRLHIERQASLCMGDVIRMESICREMEARIEEKLKRASNAGQGSGH